MRFAAERMRALRRLTAACALTLGPIFVFSRIVRSEGPHALLFGWAALSVPLLFLAMRPFRSAVLRRLLVTLAALVALLGSLTILLQVNVARRSLAEAWLALAREGDAFGFFSFFAVEIYAVFSLAPALLLFRGNYLSWLVSFAAVNFLCAGIILGSPALLAASAACGLLFLFTAGDAGMALRLRQIAFPGAAAVLGALLFTLCGTGPARPMPTPDFTGFVSFVAPAFPLLRDMPGYGFSIGVSEMPSSVFLSSRVVFHASGEALTVYYLPERRFRTWTGSTWIPLGSGNGQIPWSRSGGPGEHFPGMLRLELAEDFSSSAPILPETAAVRFSGEFSGEIDISDNTGIRFSPSARRGFVIELIPGGGAEPGALEKPELWRERIGEERIAELAGILRARAEEDIRREAAGNPQAELGASAADRRYLRLLLDHFSQGYEYSLSSPPAPGRVSSVEHFLFETKEGFCLYYASAFVLLARAGGLPARLAEGYRVALDENGLGGISGNNAHAWPEVWIEGGWRIFEPTPPYALENPFAWLDARDANARRQLEALFGKRAEKEGAAAASPASAGFPAPGAVLALGAAAAVLFVLKGMAAAALGGADRRLKRKARSLVRRYGKKGIRHPSRTGWLAWKLAVAERFPGGPGAEAARVADGMILLAYERG